VLSNVIYQRGVDEKGFGVIRSKGDTALFGGNTTQQMKEKLRIPKNRPIADFTDTVILKGKDFAASMTAYNTENKNIFGENHIAGEHVSNNTTVRKAMIERDIVPENLLPKEDIKKTERRIQSEEKKFLK